MTLQHLLSSRLHFMWPKSIVKKKQFTTIVIYTLHCRYFMELVKMQS